MKKPQRINIDFKNQRSRFSQRTNEATLIVGRKAGTEDNHNEGIATDNKPHVSTAERENSSFNVKGNALFSKSRNVNDQTPTTSATQESSGSGLKKVNSNQVNNRPVTLTVKFHEARTSTETVLLDPQAVPGAKPGDIGELQCLDGSRKKFFFMFKDPKSSKRENDLNSDTLNANSNNFSQMDFKGEQKDGNGIRKSDNSPIGDVTTAANSFISILSGPVVIALDLKPRSQVMVRLKTMESVEADTIEIYVKDIHLSRGDMWHISSLLTNQCIYKGQKLSYINGSIRLNVNKIYKNGHKLFSSYVGKGTKVVFRSDSARLIVFIQISSEMWHFEESGQQMFHKLVNSFFPKAFQKWKDIGTHHLITIILFSSVDLEGENIKYSEGETPPNKSDYYRVVVDQVHILLWNEIMATLRLEFANFKRDIYLHKNKKRDEQNPQEFVIEGSILPSVKGSILEAVNLGMSLVLDDFKDSYLRQTNNHFIMITPGTGLFDVSYDMLIRTSKLMTTVDSTVDIICMSQPPLHVVPLVRYLDNQNRLKYCIPSWLDISFWSDSSQAVHQWLPKCKIYELQMMGVMENELLNADIPDMDLSYHRSIVDAMNAYDDDAFGTKLAKKKEKRIGRPTTAETKRLPANHKITPKSSTLSMKKEEGLKPLDLLGQSNKSSASTSNAFGVTTTSKPNVSAFSTLLSLSKTTDVKTGASSAYNFVRKMISTPILKPTSPATDSDHSHTETDLHNMDALALNDSSGANGSQRISHLASRNSTASTVSVGSTNSSQLTLGRHNSDVTLSSNSSKQLTTINSRKFGKSSRQLKPRRLSKSKSSEEKDSISSSYWINISNPSNTLSSETLTLISYGRWRFVFPPNVKRRSVKWTSLSSPATLPVMTTIFPSLSDFNQNYTFRIYDVILNQSVVNENQTSDTLMKSMISLRLSLGFQICIGDKVEKVEKHRRPNGDSNMLIQALSHDNYMGARVYLSLGNEIHRLCCDYNGLINVQVYKRTTSTDERLTLTSEKEYVENIRTRYSEEYLPVVISNMSNANIRDYNWNKLDQVLAGYDDSVDKQKYHRMKFVILPAEISENAYSITNEKLSMEEIRLEGIRSLIMNIYKIRFRSNEEKKATRRREIAPEIYFYTGNLFEYLKHESNDIRKTRRSDSILSPTLDGVHMKSQFHSYDKNIPVHKLVSILQSEGGIPIMDRFWHMKLYHYCFLGMDLVNFLVENFQDIETREEALAYGNKLMEQKVFFHVMSKHRFLDGHYFYYMNKDLTEQVFPIDTKDSSAVIELPSHRNSIQSEKSHRSSFSVSTKDTNESRNDNDKLNMERGKSLRNLEEDDDADGINVTTEQIKHGKTITLSKAVLCDLDPNGYSWQPEMVKVHYDIVHNPDHCFHLRIEWLNTTTKLVEDLINGWSKYCERYGLSLVEIPWEELFTLPITNPLHSTIEIFLAINPWTDDEFRSYDEIFEREKYYFHLYLLKKGSFMLDNRTATYFKDDDFDVEYSWGKPMFKYAQFIHSTGGYIAELRSNGDFFLAPNNAHISRINLNIGKSHNLGKRKAIYFDSQSVMLEFRSLCTNEEKLREVFREGIKAYENDEDFM